jgi:16S rRNA (guanine1207-N2)-methyltransferase
MITATLRGNEFRFNTKPGLFSKDEIDAGSRLLIDHMEIRPTDAVIDLGCGYGAIGLVAASLATEGNVYMVDVDIRAVEYSQSNAELNDIKNVKVIASDGFKKVPEIEFDVVVSNPPSHMPKETIIEFIEEAHRRLCKGGRLYFVNERRIRSMIQREFERVFGNYARVAADSQYIVSMATKS